MTSASPLPLLRALKWGAFKWSAVLAARLPFDPDPPDVIFVIGCGRSGTTHLGSLLGTHTRVTYLNEPIHLWYAVDRRTDFLDFFGGRGKCWLNAEDSTPRSRLRARRIFRLHGPQKDASVLVEKLPTNTLRIPWLKALFPDARFVHIIRDGRDVVRSIRRLSRNNSYAVTGKGRLNQWWGRELHKWNGLLEKREDLPQLHDLIDELAECGADYTCMAVFEWVASVQAARTHASQLDSESYYELHYEDLVADPVSVVNALLSWLGLPCDEEVVVRADRETRRHAREGPSPGRLQLPPKLGAAFRKVLQQCGYI